MSLDSAVLSRALHVVPLRCDNFASLRRRRARLSKLARLGPPSGQLPQPVAVEQLSHLLHACTALNRRLLLTFFKQLGLFTTFQNCWLLPQACALHLRTLQ